MPTSARRGCGRPRRGNRRRHIAMNNVSTTIRSGNAELNNDKVFGFFVAHPKRAQVTLNL